VSGALAGLRVADCSRLIAGGVLATVLGDHGADVIKVATRTSSSISPASIFSAQAPAYRFMIGLDAWAARLFESEMLDRRFAWTRRILGELRPDASASRIGTP
jgi:hypothetical protein